MMGMLFAIPIGILLVTVGFYIGKSKDSHSGHVSGTVNSAACTTSAVGGHTPVTTCNLVLDYAVAGKKYEGNDMQAVQRKKGDALTVYYDPSNPSDMTVDKPKSGVVMGLIFALVGLLAIGLSIANYWLTQTHKGYAAASGTQDLMRSSGSFF
jgi:ABC-type cobalt transport system substrate-binding protein